MAAELISASIVGAPIGAGASGVGPGLVSGVYEVTSTENGDWIVLDDFDDVQYVVACTVATNIFTPAAVTVDPTTTNKITLHAGGTSVYRIFVVGTPA